MTHVYQKYISFEPLLGPVGRIPLKGIDWAIVGGESGPGARPMNPEWVISIRDQCQHANVPFFFMALYRLPRKHFITTIKYDT